MTDQYASLIYDAVCLDSVELLEACLTKHDDMDINMDISCALPRHEDVVTEENGQAVSVKGGYFVAQCPQVAPTIISALHVAIIRYHAIITCHAVDDDSDESPQCLDMIRFLLSHGASLGSKCRNISLLHLRRNDLVAVLGEDIPFEAHYLVQSLLQTNMPVEEQAGMNPVLELLNCPSKSFSKESFPTAKLLLSEKHSDVTFVCSDDETQLHAHKCILSSSSDFFDTYFDGPWGEQHPDGKWKTKFTSDVMKAFLTFVYTGKVEFGKDDAGVTCAQRVMKLAHEWNLPKLFFLAEVKCTLSISIENFPTLMTEAEVYEAHVLKHQCVKFLRENFVKVVLKHPHLMSALASDYPDLWGELSDELEPKPKRHRRT